MQKIKLRGFVKVEQRLKSNLKSTPWAYCTLQHPNKRRREFKKLMMPKSLTWT